MRAGRAQLFNRELVTALEDRVLLSTYTGTSFVLSGTSLTYVNSGTKSATVKNGDVIAGTSATSLSITETSPNNLTISSSGLNFGAISLGYTNVTTIVAVGGSNSLVVNGTGGGDTFNLASSFLSFAGIAVPYSGFNALQVNGQGGNDSFNVTANSVGATINANSGSTIAVGDGSTNPLAGIASALTVNSGSLTVAAGNANSAQTGALFASSITGLGMGGSIQYSSLSNLNINLGSGGNSFTINDTSAPTSINAGSGANAVTVNQDHSTSNIVTGSAGSVTVVANTAVTSIVSTGAATTVGSSGSSPLAGINAAVNVSGGTLTIADGTDSNGEIGTLSDSAGSGSVTGLGMSANGAV